MPAGATPIGFAAFAGIKFLGYAAAGHRLKDAYDRPSVSPWKVGLVRTGIGIVTGVSYGLLWIWLAITLNLSGSALLLWFLLLIPVRMAEWSLVLWLFFDRALHSRRRLLWYAALGTGWSYVLDVIGMLAAAVTPGGFWVC